MYATCSRRRRRAASPLQGANYVGTCVDVFCVRPSQPLASFAHIYLMWYTRCMRGGESEREREWDGWMMLFVPIAFTGLTSYFRYSGYKLPTRQTGIWASDRTTHHGGGVREGVMLHARTANTSPLSHIANFPPSQVYRESNGATCARISTFLPSNIWIFDLLLSGVVFHTIKLQFQSYYF